VPVPALTSWPSQSDIPTVNDRSRKKGDFYDEENRSDWSGTGNTKQMAEAVLEGMKSAGADAVLLEAAQVDASTFSGVDAVAFGCPAMGSEVLEEMEFEPMFSACKSHLSGKKVALFGSYGWGDGEWMRSWEKDCDDAGINLVCESVICQETPDGDTLEACRAMGKLLAE